jgi:fatty-acyl-CoA synthase
MERFEPKAALALIERERCTVYYGVAPVTRALVACEDLATRDISSLRTGTANATPEDLRLAIEVLGVTEVCNAYGLTEGHGHSTITRHTDPPEVRIGTQGVVLPTQELRVLRPDGSTAGVDEHGAIQLRGTITPGYLDAPELNAAAFDADGWFSTGDIGFADADGNLHFVGRSHEMMRVKGINISPAEVEQLLVRHPGVDEAFVFGIDVGDGEQQVAGVLVSSADPDARGQLVVDVTAWARTQVSSFKVPSRLWVVTAADLPLTATGKVSKRVLAEAATSGEL